MTRKKAIIIKLTFFLTVVVAVYFGNRHFKQIRVERTIESTLGVQSSIDSLFGLSGGWIASSTDTIEPGIPNRPSDPHVKRALGDSFGEFIRSNWSFAIRLRDRYRELAETKNASNPTEDDYAPRLQFEGENGKQIQVDFYAVGIVSAYREITPEGTPSAVITYYRQGTPNTITYFAQPALPLSVRFTFHENGVLNLYATYYQWGHLGPGILWDESGSVIEERFRSRPYYGVNEDRPI